MRFVITRRSASDCQPCDDAKKLELTELRKRTWKSFEEARTNPYGHTYFDVGKNHRVENGMCVHEVPWSFWVLEVENLEALLTLTSKVGDIKVSKGTSGCVEVPDALEIQDTDY